ncbi:hypothetical protein [Glaesserella sp.]
MVLTGFDECGTLPMKEMGSFSVLSEFVGNGISAIHRVKSVQELVGELMG